MRSTLQHARERAILLPGVLCLLLAASVIRAGPEANGDGRLATVYAVVDRGTLVIDEYVAQEPSLATDAAIVGGRYYMAKPPLPSLLLIPVYAALRAFFPAATMLDAWWRWALIVALSGVSIAVMVVLVGTLQRPVAPAVAPLGALAVATGTPLIVYATFLFSHVLSAVLLVALTLVALRSPRLPVVAGLMFGALASTDYLTAAGGCVPFAFVLYRRWRAAGMRALVRPVVGAGIGAAPLPAYLTVVFGSPLANMYTSLATPEFRVGYETGAIGLPRPDIALTLLASPHRGLLVFAPLIMLGAWQMLRLWRVRDDLRSALALSAATSAVIFVLTSAYVFWYGGASYGPRYLLPLFALLAWPIASLRPRTLALVGLLAAVPQIAVLHLADPLLDVSVAFPYAEYVRRMAAGEVATFVPAAILGGPSGSGPALSLLALTFAFAGPALLRR